MKKHPTHIHNTVYEYINNPEIAEGYDEYFNNSELFKTDCRFILDELPESGRVLDGGCGSGRHLVFLEKNGYEAYGIDLSEHFLKVARNKLTQHSFTPRLYHGDILNPPIDTREKFSAILLMFSVLGMVKGRQNRIEALKTLARYLAPQGKIILHIHNREYGSSALRNKLSLIRSRLRGRNDGLEEGDYIMKSYRGLQDLYLHSFSLGEINHTLSSAGLKICTLFPLNHDRSGICPEKNIPTQSNGFLISATIR